ncbi:hypothetical protein Tco_1151315 [Tanacetum coccineum]
MVTSSLLSVSVMVVAYKEVMEPTSVSVIWFPFTNRNSDQPQTGVQNLRTFAISAITNSSEVESGKLKFVCQWANPIKDFKWSNVPRVKLSSLSKSDDTFLSLQELLDLYYLFDGFMDYFWKILLVSANGMNAKSLLYRSQFPDDDKTCRRIVLGCLTMRLHLFVLRFVVPAGSSSSVPADYVSAGHVLIPADRDRIC